MTTPAPADPDHPREILRAALMAYRDGFESDGAGFWFANAFADLRHLWHDLDPGGDLGGFFDAITRGMRYADPEHRERVRDGAPLP